MTPTSANQSAAADVKKTSPDNANPGSTDPSKPPPPVQNGGAPGTPVGGRRPLSAGRARNLRRRFTTPEEFVSPTHGSSNGSVSSLALHIQNTILGETPENVIITDITVTSSETIDDIQTLIIHLSDNLRCIRLRYCTQLTSANLHDIITIVTPKLLSFEIRETEDLDRFDLSHLEHLVTKCKHLRALHFENCFGIDHRCLQTIGKHLPEVQNIAFIHTKRKPWPDNPIHEIVTHIPLELHSVKFVGFDDIADYHVNYAVDCYSASLNAISLGDCPQITDRSVDYIATNCKLLRHVELFKTNITDSTLWILAKHCANLHYIDLSYCPKITDYGVKELVTHATHLRYVNLSWNPKIKDLTFQSILRHCATIVRIKLDGTAITKVPSSIIKRKLTLKEVTLTMCKEMTTVIPVTSQNGSGLTEFIEQLEDRNLNYRLKVFFVGATGTGKTEVIRALMGKGANQSTQEGVNVEPWRPFKDGDWAGIVTKEITEDERELTLDLWDCQGREVLRGVHPIYFTDVCVYVVMCSFDDSNSVEKVPKLIHTIYEKTQRPQIFVLATRSDKFTEDECQKKLDIIKRSVDSGELVRRNSINVELAFIQELPDTSAFQAKIHELQKQAEEKYTIRKYLAVNASSTKSVDVFRKLLLNLCLDGTTFPHLKRPVPAGWIELHDDIIKLRENKIVCMNWHDFEQLAVKDERVSKPRILECVGFLHQIGVILDIRTRHTVAPTDLVCINPAVLAQCACALHIDDQKKSFRFEAKRFWPRDQGIRPPEAAVLALALEDIPNRGLLKESLLPLVWQEFALEEEQVIHVKTILFQACLLSLSKSNRPAPDSLILPAYPKLQPQNLFVIPLLGLLPDTKPQLNWTTRPFQGDVQISLYLYFLPVIPPGLAHRLIALVNNAIVESSSYHYYWKYGVLNRISDILVFVSCEPDGFLEISARVTAEDDYDTTCVESLWLELSFVMDLVMEFMTTGWIGTKVTVSLICYGDIFYMEDKIETEPELTLAKVYHYAKMKDDIQFKDGGDDKFLETTKLIPYTIAPTENQDFNQWITLLLEHREKIQGARKLSPPSPDHAGNSQESSPSQSRPKKKKISINWSVPDGGQQLIANPEAHRLNGNTVVSAVASPRGLVSPVVTPREERNTIEEAAAKAEELVASTVPLVNAPMMSAVIKSTEEAYPREPTVKNIPPVSITTTPAKPEKSVSAQPTVKTAAARISNASLQNQNKSSSELANRNSRSASNGKTGKLRSRTCTLL